jgi:4,4'-diaponeurosporenoate glycosyltransferase
MIGWLVGWWLLWRVPLVGERSGRSGWRDHGRGGVPGTGVDRSPGTSLADCSVIIPARNEARSIGILLRSLAAQPQQPLQVIVVDDQSDDGTGALARGFPGVTVVEGEPVPEGWMGKAWACHQGTRLSSGSTLVYLDADVELAPGSLEALVAEHSSRGGLVSVQPFHTMHRAYERLSALFNVVGFMGIGAASPGRDARSRGAYGPALVTSREDYLRVGGHDRVRGEIVEDIALAGAFARAGLPVHTFGGGDAVAFRMYPGGLGQLLEGWSKNVATGAGSVGLGRLFLIGFWLTTLLISVQYVIEQRVGSVDTSVGLVVAVYVLFAVQLGVMLRQLGNFGLLTALLYPGPLGVFILVFVLSVYLTLVRRQVVWRGRRIPLSRSRRGARTHVHPDT